MEAIRSRFFMARIHISTFPFDGSKSNPAMMAQVPVRVSDRQRLTVRRRLAESGRRAIVIARRVARLAVTDPTAKKLPKAVDRRSIRSVGSNSSG